MNKPTLNRPRQPRHHRPRKQARPTNNRPAQTTPAPVVILHVKIWYGGGIQGEINITSPNLYEGDFVENQYYYIKQYLRKVGGWMKLEAYQASICFPRPDGTIKVLGTYAKVLFTPDQAYGAGQHCACEKGGLQHG